MIFIPSHDLLMKQLEEMGNGVFRTKWIFGEWIDIQVQEDGFKVMVTNKKDGHQPLDSTAFTVKYEYKGLGYVMRSYITMVPVYEDDKRAQIGKLVAQKVNTAYRRWKK